MTTRFSPRPFREGLAFVNEAQKSGLADAAQRMKVPEAEARAWWDWHGKEVCTPWVIHESPEGIEEVQGRDGNATDMAALPLIVQDATEAAFRGKVYPLAGEGLYRFVVMTQSVRNLIVARGNHLLPILQGLSALQVHGNRENHKPLNELKALLPIASFLCITCGTIASLAANVLTDLGFKTRLVGGLTTEDWNTYDNGHCLFEVYDPRDGKWILADVDMGFLFRRGQAFLDAGEVWQCLQQGPPSRTGLTLTPLASKIMDPFFSSPTGFNWFLRFRHNWATLEGKWAWYRRILQVVSISEGDKRICVGDREKVLWYEGEKSVEVLPYPEWRERLYGKQIGG